MNRQLQQDYRHKRRHYFYREAGDPAALPCCRCMVYYFTGDVQKFNDLTF